MKKQNTVKEININDNISNSTNKNLSDILNNPPRNELYSFSQPNAIDFLPISGPGGKGIGVTTKSSGTIVGITFPGNGEKALSKPSVQITNSTNLNSSGSLQLNTALSQPLYAKGNETKLYAGFTFKL